MVKLATTPVILLALAFLGCNEVETCRIAPDQATVVNSTTVDVLVSISHDFSDSERANIIEGIELWETALGGIVSYNVVDSPDDVESALALPQLPMITGHNVRGVNFYKAFDGQEQVKEWDSHTGGGRMLGLCKGSSKGNRAVTVYVVEDRLSTQTAQVKVAGHEFGHALGLDHIDAKDALMTRFNDDSMRCLSKADINEFCGMYNCDPANMTPVCIPPSAG